MTTPDTGNRLTALRRTGSERLIDAIIPHGPSVIAGRTRQHLQAGADHVLLQPLGADGGFAFSGLAPLAEALDGL